MYYDNTEYLTEAIDNTRKKQMVTTAIKKFQAAVNKSDLTSEEKECVKMMTPDRVMKSKDFLYKHICYIGAYNFSGCNDNNPYGEIKAICKQLNRENPDLKFSINFKMDTVSWVLFFLFGGITQAILDHGFRKKTVGVIQLNIRRSTIKEYYEDLYREEKEEYDSLLEAYNELLLENKKNDIIQIINQLPDLLYIGGASPSAIKQAEDSLGLKFASEYKKYLQEFGAISFSGTELTGLTKSKHANVVSLTMQEWEMNSSIPHKMYVIENLGIEGVFIWQDKSGSIYQSSPNRSPRKIYGSLSEYILSKYN